MACATQVRFLPSHVPTPTAGAHDGAPTLSCFAELALHQVPSPAQSPDPSPSLAFSGFPWPSLTFSDLLPCFAELALHQDRQLVWTATPLLKRELTPPRSHWQVYPRRPQP